jgi:glycosyltransferase involved in cell wall biosynthesis
MLNSSITYEPQETLPFVSVIIATYKRGNFLVDTIVGIMDNNYPRFELIVVDQTSSYPPEISTRLEALIDEYHLNYYKLDLPSVTVARNVGIRKAKGEIIIFCDDDVQVGKEYISSHVQAYQDPRVGGIAGRIISKIDEKLAHPSGLIGRLNADGNYIANFHLEQPGEAEICMGCNMSFRAAIFRRFRFDAGLKYSHYAD